MSTITNTKKYRLFDGLKRRQDPMPAQPRQHVADCRECGGPIMLSAGQIQRPTHKACRLFGKHKIKKHGKK